MSYIFELPPHTQRDKKTVFLGAAVGFFDVFIGAF